MIDNENKWLNWVKNVATGAFGTLRVIIQIASDDSAEIAIRALPLVSPMPNAIGLFFVAQSALGFGAWQAATFALSSELALFGLVDVLLRVFDGYLADRKRYTVPLWAASLCAILMLGIIVGVVYKLEVSHAGGNGVLAVLPFISGVGAIALAIRRWDKQQINSDIAKLQLELVTVTGLVEQRQTEAVELQTKLDGQTVLVTTQNQTITELRAQIAGLTERAEFWQTQFENKPTGVLEPAKQPAKPSSTVERRMAVLRAISQTAKRSDVNFTELGAQYGVSDTAIKKDVEWLVGAEYWVNGDVWKPTRKGIEWVGLEVNSN